MTTFLEKQKGKKKYCAAIPQLPLHQNIKKPTNFGSHFTHAGMERLNRQRRTKYVGCCKLYEHELGITCAFNNTTEF